MRPRSKRSRTVAVMTFTPIILFTLAISTAFAAIPMEPDKLLDDLVSGDVQVSGGTCTDVCSVDKCKGTWTNPVPNGKKWYKIRSSYKGGCCAWGAGKCDRCCSTAAPTPVPTARPTRTPTFYPSPAPSRNPTDEPTTLPPTTDEPTFEPTHTPTHEPTPNPTYIPTADPTFDPTRSPTPNPTEEPTTLAPTTDEPSYQPTHTPTNPPTRPPTRNPTVAPTFATSRCARVCASDRCKGTWTNPIPSGQQWTTVSRGVYTSSSGCCSFWSGACSTCCH